MNIFTSTVRHVGQVGWLAMLAIACIQAPRFATAQDAAAKESKQPVFEVRFSEDVHEGPYTGRVYLFFSRTAQPPRFGPNWFSPEPFVAREVENWKPGEPLKFDAGDAEQALSFPRPMDQLQLSGHYVQAVARFNPLDPNVGTGVGNGFSSVKRLPTGGDASQEKIELLIDTLEPERPFEETAEVRLLRVRSASLSKFHGRDVFLQASVVLPPSYKTSPDRRYPTIFEIPGFGGSHHVRHRPSAASADKRVEFLKVNLDPASPWGHHVFANSATNGPVGDALVNEFIPEFDRQYRSLAEPPARFLTGHSSGGWSSLWLQVAYPEFFGGVWSTAPDPVDFRDFQRINIYEDENVYRDDADQLRPLVRRGEDVLVRFRQFDQMEWVLGPGGQLRSFEAVFSPVGSDGKPQRLWDRSTGEINHQVAEAWAKYDIRKVLESNWQHLAPKLAGKLHVYMGDLDTFYLDGATRKLKQTLAELESDAVVELYPGRNHFDLLTRELRNAIRQDMIDTFLASYPDYLDK